jgi:hypothetical protein
MYKKNVVNLARLVAPISMLVFRSCTHNNGRQGVTFNLVHFDVKGVTAVPGIHRLMFCVSMKIIPGPLKIRSFLKC